MKTRFDIGTTVWLLPGVKSFFLGIDVIGTYGILVLRTQIYCFRDLLLPVLVYPVIKYSWTFYTFFFVRELHDGLPRSFRSRENGAWLEVIQLWVEHNLYWICLLSTFRVLTLNFHFAGYDATGSSTLPISPGNSSAVPPAVAVNPQDTSGSGNNSVAGNPSSMSDRSRHLIPFIYTFVMILIPILAIVWSFFLIPGPAHPLYHVYR